MIIIAILAGGFLAFSNGANDNFKGVATLLGSKTTNYKIALKWATVTTLAGSITAIFFAQKLLMNFSGKGLVPDSVVELPAFAVAVSLAAALTVYLATRLGFPISTTHAITGALMGAGFIASAGNVNFEKLQTSFFLPLMISPFVAIMGSFFLYPTLSFFRKKLRVTRESCICIGNQVLMPAPAHLNLDSAAAMVQVDCVPLISVGTTVTCEERYIGNVGGISAKGLIDFLHFLSGGLVGFARGLNDTPKIAAIILVGNSVNPSLSVGLVALLMGAGGLIYARKIAETMSFDITEMNDGQGLSANLLTSAIVIGASQLGLPVSTTHVSCGSLFGIGAITGKGNWKSIAKIILAWLITLPVSVLAGIILFHVLQSMM